MIFSYAATCLKGKGREENHDCIVVNGSVIIDGHIEGFADGHILAAVCDGVGTAPQHLQAARIVCSHFQKIDNNNNPPMSVSGQLRKAHQSLRNESSDPITNPMASTIAGIYADDEELVVFNVGDSRIYESGQIGFRKLSIDHTRAQAMVDARFALTTNELPNRAQQTLIRYLGGSNELCRPHLSIETPEEEGRRIVICSDGVWRCVREDILSTMMDISTNAASCCETICKSALFAGSRDDLSVLVIDSL